MNNLFLWQPTIMLSPPLLSMKSETQCVAILLCQTTVMILNKSMLAGRVRHVFTRIALWSCEWVETGVGCYLPLFRGSFALDLRSHMEKLRPSKKLHRACWTTMKFVVDSLPKHFISLLKHMPLYIISYHLKGFKTTVIWIPSRVGTVGIELTGIWA